MSGINTLEKTQIGALYSQSYTANMAVLATGILTYIFFYFSIQANYIDWFFLILCIAIITRVTLTFYINRCDKKYLKAFANAYVIASLIIGLDFSILSLTYYDLKEFDLRFFLIIVHVGLITSAIVTLSVWMQAYLAFTLPQLISLILIFSINGNISAVLITAIFSGFILIVAKRFNTNFKDGRVLIEKNSQLITNMEEEIVRRKTAQLELEEHKNKLEDIIYERTCELKNINENLVEQMRIREETEKKLEYLAYYDDLTELPNRSLFIENLKKALSLAKRKESLLGVLFVDLDRFKNINDSHGHYIGDGVLKNVADRLREILRDSDTIARNGGDEFVILMENMKDVREPYVVANKIIELLNTKFNVEGHDIHIGASVGIAMYPLDGDNALDLLKMSDTAMYEAKKIGRNNFQFYSSSMSNQIADRLKMENALREALDKNEFFLVYQPQVNLITQKTVGFEALLRWNNYEFGFVSPAEFIPILEETGLIYQVGEWIILEALNFITSGKSKGKKVSINLSPLQCSINNYAAQIKKIIEKTGVDATLVEFEITESLLINDFSQTEMFLSDISKLGCTIALDDFGTGYTSFSYLTKLPIDIIKIDRSLVTSIETNRELQNIVRAIITMSENLNIENVFEGVETESELEKIAQLNGKIIQGYLFSRPLEESKISEWFKLCEENAAKYKTQ
ncbi:MAG: EAL domain-containing protein [Gammaproteobacteria bacterium]|nr:EAL domain-containing protein [Gammaproteobacteria bacterium]